jgi:hypothetical protein
MKTAHPQVHLSVSVHDHEGFAVMRAFASKAAAKRHSAKCKRHWLKKPSSLGSGRDYADKYKAWKVKAPEGYIDGDDFEALSVDYEA